MLHDSASFRWLYLLMVPVSLLLLWGIVSSPKKASHVDFLNYWATGQIITQANAHQIYDRESQVGFAREIRENHGEQLSQRGIHLREGGYLYLSGTPLQYVVLSFYGLFSFATATLIHGLIWAGAYLLAVYCWSRVMGLHLAIGLFSFTLALMVWVPLKSDWFVGNVNLFQLAALGSVLCLHQTRSKHLKYLAPCVLGVLIMFKPNLLLCAPAWVLGIWVSYGYKRALLEMTIGSAGLVMAVILSSLAFRSWQIWPAWYSSVGDQLQASGISNGNVSLSQWIFELTGVYPDITLLVVGLFILVLTVLIGRWWAQGRDQAVTPKLQMPVMMLFAVALSFLSIRVMWSHYLVLLLPAALVIATACQQDFKWLKAVAVSLSGVSFLLLTSDWASYILPVSAEFNLLIRVYLAVISTILLANLFLFKQDTVRQS